MLQNGSEQLCAIRLESSAVPTSSDAKQSRQEEEVKPGNAVNIPILLQVSVNFSSLIQLQFLGGSFTPKDILLESATKILHTSQGHDSEDIDVIQAIRNSGDAGIRGDDWEEVSFKCTFVLADIYR